MTHEERCKAWDWLQENLPDAPPWPLDYVKELIDDTIASEKKNAALRERVALLETALAHIANDYKTSRELIDTAGIIGLTAEEHLEMAYDNMQQVAKDAIEATAVTEGGE